MKLSLRSQAVQSSGIRRVFDLAATMKDPVNLSIGQPNFDAFPEMKEAIQSAVFSGKNGYTQTQGIAPVLEDLRKHYDCTPGSGKNCFLTSGVSGGIFLAYMAILDPVDEILIPDPYFGMYKDLAALINSVPVTYDTYPDFRVRAENIEKKINAKTRAILLASPSNPTGKSIAPGELSQVVDIARKHDLFIVYDEIYSSFSFDKPHTEIKTDYDQVLILNGFSKSHGIPGWRVGYAVGPEALIQQMMKVQQYSFVCTPSVAQWGVLAGLHHEFDAIRNDYREKRDLIYQGISDLYEVEKPDGAFYIFPKVPFGTGTEFFERLVKENLLVVPGSCFSPQDTHIRISFSASREAIERGVEILRRVAK